MKFSSLLLSILFLCCSFSGKKHWSITIQRVSNLDQASIIGSLIDVDVTDENDKDYFKVYGVSSFCYLLIRGDSVIAKGNVTDYIIPLGLRNKAQKGDIITYYNLKCDSVDIPKNYSLTVVAPLFERK